jgi:hypothetical protein
MEALGRDPSTPNQVRLLRALVAVVLLMEETGIVEAELVNLTTDAGSIEAG